MTSSENSIDKHACLSRELSSRHLQVDGTPHPCILLIGTDVPLRTTRAEIFKRAGFKTLCHSDLGTIEQSLLAQADIVLICRSVPAQDAAALALDVYSRFPQLHIIRMADANEKLDAHYSFTFEHIAHPGALLAEVDRLLHMH